MVTFMAPKQVTETLHIARNKEVETKQEVEWGLVLNSQCLSCLCQWPASSDKTLLKGFFRSVTT